MKSIFLILSILLPLYSPIPYIRSILSGKTKPHRTTRIVYLAIGILTTLALFVSGDRIALWISAVSTLQSAVLFFLGLKYGVGGWSKTDIACLVLAITGIAVWKAADNPALGLYFGIAADFAGTVPTIIKSYRFPKTEYWGFYCLDALAGVCSLLALTSFKPVNFLYPLYLALINAWIAKLTFPHRHTVTILSSCAPHLPDPPR